MAMTATEVIYLLYVVVNCPSYSISLIGKFLALPEFDLMLSLSRIRENKEWKSRTEIFFWANIGLFLDVKTMKFSFKTS